MTGADTICRHIVDAQNEPGTHCSVDGNGGNTIVDGGEARRSVGKRGPKPQRRKSKPAKNIENQQLEFLLQAVERSQDARDTVKAMLAARRGPKIWRGFIATPPGSLLETIVGAFLHRTDFPLEIPFFATLHFVAAWLLKNGVSINFAGSNFRPDLWTVILASSGAGKTFVTNRLESVLAVNADFPEPASAAKFVADLAEHNHGFWVRDEFSQLLRGIEQQPHLAELRDYLLRVYDGKRVERRTKKEEIVIENPALVILGLTVLESFGEHVSPESMVDGFAQRFGYVIARRDENRDPREFAIYDLRGEEEAIRGGWKRVSSCVEKGARYRVTDGGEEAFRQAFAALMPNDIPLSFYRRVLFRAIKYALLYHVLLCRPGVEIDAEDISWAARVCWLQLQDAAELIADHGLPDLERIIRAAETVRQRLVEAGQPCALRDIVRGVRGIRTTAEARAIMSLLS